VAAVEDAGAGFGDGLAGADFGAGCGGSPGSGRGAQPGTGLDEARKVRR